MCLIRFETVLAFSKQKSLNLNLFTMKNINDLPDQCLRTIFSKLPLRDLLRIDQVCPAWERIQPSVCLMRKELTILIGDEPDELIEDLPFTLPHYDELLNDNQNCPKAVVAVSQSKIENQNQLEFDWLDRHSVKLLTRLLPNIATVCIAIRHVVSPVISFGEKSWGIKTSLLNQVTVLLKKWSRSVQTLKLLIKFDESTEYEELIVGDLQSLFCTINSFKTLRHLKFKLDNGYYYGNYYEIENKQLDLSILGRLEEFYFEHQSDISLVSDSLDRYAKDALNLRAIAIDGIFRDIFDTNDRYDKNLAEKFTQLPDLEFSDANLAMRNFCEHFNRLERLRIRIYSDAQEIYKFIKLIRPLKNLIYLEIDFRLNEDDKDNRRRIVAAEKEPDFESIPSVKIIKIFALLRSHTQLYSIQWDRMFPNLEILHCNNFYYDCIICKPKNNINNDLENYVNELLNEEDDEKEKRHDKCQKLSLLAWKHCGKLHSVYYAFRYSNLKKISLDELYDRD